MGIESFKILDLFSGAGGFSFGMEKNKHFQTVIAVDFNPNALATFKYNMPNTQIINGDITDPKVKDEIIELSKALEVNMIIGGPPCQGFSLKGKKLGLEDPRNYLFNEYLNIVEKVQPDVFIIENRHRCRAYSPVAFVYSIYMPCFLPQSPPCTLLL